jgi:hypothetical protein
LEVNLIFIIIFFLYNFFYKNVYFCYCSEYSKTIDLKIKGIFTIKFIEHDLQNPNDFNHCGIHCLLFLENLLQDLNLSHLQYNAEDLKSKRITIYESFERLSSKKHNIYYYLYFFYVVI